MRRFDLCGTVITEDTRQPVIIAEIGCNHGGSLEAAKRMIEIAADCGANAVKIQVRHNESMFTRAALERPYESEMSYGRTYGEHRDKLDWFGRNEITELFNHAYRHGILMLATPFEGESAELLNGLHVPAFKIASCDVTNTPLIEQVGKYGKPMIISAGGATFADIDRVCQVLDGINDNYMLMHCVSVYPNRDYHLNLNMANVLMDRYPNRIIGFSSHHPGILPIYTAYMLGVRVFELHFTLDRSQRGTDHAFSMEPAGLRKICEDLKRIDVMLGTGERYLFQEEKTGFVCKMGKAVYAGRDLPAGSVLTEADLAVKSPYIPGGIRPYELPYLIGSTNSKTLGKEELITWEVIEKRQS